MKYLIWPAAALVLTMGLVACKAARDYSGTYIGYSWKDEAKGVTLDQADEKIETILKLDKDGAILDARLLFWQEVDGYWTTRRSGNAQVSVDFSIDPKAATPGDNYKI